MFKGLQKFVFLAASSVLALTPLTASAVSIDSGIVIDGGAYIKTWVHTNTKGEPIEIGFTAPVGAFQDLPNQMVEYEKLFPQVSGVPFHHLAIDWEPHGHDPAPIYGVPHFDVHFYLLTPEQRHQITCAGADKAVCLKMPAADMIPPDYVQTPDPVPQMGWHWVDGAAEEFHGQPFKATLVYGYYNGKMAFIEPMITAAFLASRPHFSAPIKQPKVYPVPGYYPTTYSVHYDSIKDAYEIALGGMVYRN